MQYIKSQIKYFTLILFTLIVSSCGGGSKDEPESPDSNLETNYSSKILGLWYGCGDIEGFDMLFKNDGTMRVLDQDFGYNYKISGNKLVVEKWADLSGDIISIDEKDMYLFSNNKFYRHFSRTKPSGGSPGSGDNQGGGSGSGTANPYSNYIHYRSMQTSNYYHEIKYVKQESEFAEVGTIHGWNYKYLNFYIGDSRYKVGFQFESTYRADEYPPTSLWPAMKYEITSTSGNSLTHFPIARVFVYDNNMKLLRHYPTVGVGEIKYIGNKMIFDFTSKEKNPDYFVDIHFEGVLSN